MPRLFHISEENNINEFLPRESKKHWNYEKYVWAISEDKVHHYLFPRKCPRICISEKLHLFAKWINFEIIENMQPVIFVSNDWKESIYNCTLYQYEFNPANFTEIDKIAGYYVSKSAENPINTIVVNNCLAKLKRLKIEVVSTENQSLRSIKDIVLQNLTEFSILKWSNLMS